MRKHIRKGVCYEREREKILIGTGIAFGALAAVLGGMSLFDKSTLPPDEDYGEWVVTRAPTCEERGVETRALLSSPEVTQVLEIPATYQGLPVTGIMLSAFSNAPQITRVVVLGNNLQKIGNRAFFGWTEEQAVIIKGFASLEETDAAWDSAWREGCNATILYEKQDSEQVSEL